MIVHCQACGQQMALPEGQPGMRWACPRCRAIVGVPCTAFREADPQPAPAPSVVLGPEDLVPAPASQATAAPGPQPPPLPPQGPAPAVVSVTADAGQVESPEAYTLGDGDFLDDGDDAGGYGLAPEAETEVDPWGHRPSLYGAVGTLAVGWDGGPARCLALTADGRVGLVGCDETIVILDLTAKKRCQRFEKQEATLSCLALSPDGRLALSGDEGGGLLLWDVFSARALRWLEGHDEAVRTVAISPDGRHAASGGDDGVIRLWELATGRELPLAKARWDEAVQCVTFSPSGRKLLAAGAKVRTWSVPDGQPLVRYPGGAGMCSAAFSRDGAEILACAPDRHRPTGFRAERWKTASGTPVPCFDEEVHGRLNVSLALVAPGTLRVAVAGRKQGVKAGSNSSGVSSGFMNSLGASIAGTVALNVMLGPVGCWGYMIFRSSDTSNGFVNTYEPTDLYALKCWSYVTGLADAYGAGKVPITTLAISPDGRKALSATRSNVLQLWSLPP